MTVAPAPRKTSLFVRVSRRSRIIVPSVLVAHVGVSGPRAGSHAVGAIAVRPGSSVTSAVAPIGDGNEGGEFGGGGLHGDVFSLKLSRTPQITGVGARLSIGPWSYAERQRADRRAREKGLQKNAGTMSTKRIFTMVMAGKIIA